MPLPAFVKSADEDWGQDEGGSQDLASSGPITSRADARGLGSLHSLSSLSPAPYCGMALGFWPLLALEVQDEVVPGLQEGAGGAACPNCLAVIRFVCPEHVEQ